MNKQIQIFEKIAGEKRHTGIGMEKIKQKQFYYNP